MKLLLFILASLSASAQSLSLACPAPGHNLPAVCTLSFTAPVSRPTSGLQWILTTKPPVAGITARSLVSSKQLAASANGTMILFGMNSLPLTGAVASVTIPRHSGNLRVELAGVLGSSASGHAQSVIPAISIAVP